MTPPADSPFQEDIVYGKAFDRTLFRRLLRYALPYRARILQVLATIVLATLLGLVGPFLMRYAIDHPLRAALTARGEVPPGALAEIGRLAAIFLAASALLAVLRFVQNYGMAWIGQRAMYDLRSELFEGIGRMPLAFFDANPVGRLVTRVTSDVEALNELFSSGVVSFLADALVLVAVVAALLWVDWRLALVTLLALPFLLAATLLFRSKARQYYREQRGHLAHLNAFTQETIQGMSVVQLFHREEKNEAQYRAIHRAYLTAFQKTVLAYSLYFPAVEVIGTFALAGILWQAAARLGAGGLTFGNFYLFWYLLGRFFQPIRDMAERYNVLQSAMASAERIFKVLDARERVPRKPAAAAPRGPGGVAFRNVWFAYRDEEFVLKDVTFEVAPRELVAIVGATGAGKTTVISLLGRYYDPQRGAVEVDGVDARELDPRELRRRIGTVPQDVFLFSRSVRENIRLGAPWVSDEDVERAARITNAHEFISRLEGGYDHVLGERGATLSAGERQLLAFARAIARSPDFLVLDEATANVDSQTEARIQDALEKLLADRTAIVIAHRLSTIRRARRILVLHKGELREEGAHEELLRRGGIYARLYELEYR